MRQFYRVSLVLTLLAATLAAAQPAKRGLPFIEDDFAKAFEQARARKLPLFVEAWAPG